MEQFGIGKQFGELLDRDWLYLIFWPVFVLRYLIIENLTLTSGFHEVYTPLDDLIPFCEWFVIPYVLWYVCIVGTHLFLLIHDRAAFRAYSEYLIVSVAISTLIFWFFPTCQNLRPEQFPRENGLTTLVRLVYTMDTNTNVCPSEHVIISVGFFLAAASCPKLERPVCLTMFGAAACLTGIATVFIKQHSLVDVAVAIPVSIAAAYISFGKKERKMES